MRKLVSLLSAFAVISTVLVFGAPSHASTALPTITTCTNPVNKSQFVIHADQKGCPRYYLPAIWHLTPSGSAATISMNVCTTKNELLTYQIIRNTCPKYQNSNTYYRVASSPDTQQILATTPLSFDGVLLTLSPEAPSDSPIAYYLVKNLTTGQISAMNLTGKNSLYIYKLKAKTDYSFQIIAVSVDGLSRYVASSKSVSTGAMPIVPTIVTIQASCAAGGSCSIGDTGPGGGTVFYVNTNGFNCGPTFSATGSPTGGLCHYLEVPSNTWFGGSADPLLPWAKAGFTNIDVPGLTNIGPVQSFESNAVTVLQNPANPGAGLGAGYANTLAIVSQQGACSLASCTYAAGAAQAYSNNSLTDWYLPDPTELNQLLAWARAETRALTNRAGPASAYVNGDLSVANYLSSNAVNSSVVWYQYSAPGGGLNEGVINGANKSDAALRLRPIRAF